MNCVEWLEFEFNWNSIFLLFFFYYFIFIIDSRCYQYYCLQWAMNWARWRFIITFNTRSIFTQIYFLTPIRIIDGHWIVEIDNFPVRIIYQINRFVLIGKINKYLAKVNYVTGETWVLQWNFCASNVISSCRRIFFSMESHQILQKKKTDWISLTFAITSDRYHGSWFTADIEQQPST